MSFVLEKHRERLREVLDASRAQLVEIEADIRLRAMSSDESTSELAFLQRLKEETGKIVDRYENLEQAFNAILRDVPIAAE